MGHCIPKHGYCTICRRIRKSILSFTDSVAWIKKSYIPLCSVPIGPVWPSLSARAGEQRAFQISKQVIPNFQPCPPFSRPMPINPFPLMHACSRAALQQLRNRTSMCERTSSRPSSPWKMKCTSWEPKLGQSNWHSEAEDYCLCCSLLWAGRGQEVLTSNFNIIKLSRLKSRVNRDTTTLHR